MKLRHIFFFLAASLFVACNEDKIETFDMDVQGIYFQYGGQTRLYINSEAYFDSISYSFSTARENLTDTILSTRLRTLGKVKDYDRKVKLTVDAGQTTAVEGVHYELNLDTVAVKAGQSSATISVRFLRAADLMNKRVQLVLKVEPNENFVVPFAWQKNTNVYSGQGDSIRADQFRFVTSEIYTQPSYWRYVEEYMGPWTVNKFRYINKICGIPTEDWNRGGYSDSKVQSGRFPIYVYLVRNALQAAADAGQPVLDDDGSYMQLGDNYRVDYSAYIGK